MTTTIHGYYRQPTINQDTVVFVCEDDLWTVPTKGGIARRLTANLGSVSFPVLSPDGQWLAFVGSEDGEVEIYVMPAVGGPAQRLTYLGSDTTVVGWTADSQQLLFVSNSGQFYLRNTMLYQIAREGGHPQPYHYGPLKAVSFNPHGKGMVIGRRTSDLARWKRYRGGQAGDIWIDPKGAGKFKPLIKHIEGNLASPMWFGKRIYFISDHEGVGNLYSCKPSGKDLQRHTHHEDFYVRYPQTDGSQFVYQAGADLYRFDPQTDECHKINIEFHSPRVQRHRKFVTPNRYLDDYTIHPDGHSFALTARGKPFSMSNWAGAAIQYGNLQGVRYRLMEWLNDGKRLVMLSDESGEELLEVYKTGENQRIALLDKVDIGRALFLEISPTSNEIVLGNHRYELLHINETGQLKKLDQSHYGRIYRADWSPDGKWVVYQFPTSLSTCAIKVCHVETGETHFVTPPNNLYDYGPSFDPEGKYIYFLSTRVFNPVHDDAYFDWAFPEGTKPYLVTLRRDIPNPFITLPNGHPPQSNGDKKPAAEKNEPEKPAENSDKEKSEEKSAPALQLDLEDIQQRVVAFPMSEARYSQIRGILKGKVIYTRYHVEGVLPEESTPRKSGHNTLYMYDLGEQKEEYLTSGVSGFDVSRKKGFIIYRNYRDVRIIKAGEKPDNTSSGFNKKSGWVKIARAKVAINPPEEWQQMLREAWRLQRDHFWSADMSQVDWAEVYLRYQTLLERVTTRTEFSDLVWEMQGELGTSHAYEYGGDHRHGPRYQQGFLGADFEYDVDHDGYRITHIVQGDSWVEESTSPLNRLGMMVQVGDVLMGINGQRLSRSFGPQQALVHHADDEIQLDLLVLPPTEEPASPPQEEVSSSTLEDENEPETSTSSLEIAEVDDSPPVPDEAETPAESELPPKITTRPVIVKTLRSETKARYREWVKQNRRQVHEQSEGRVGYLHIPDMGASGFAEFHRYYLAESEREGLIVDVRYNRGGNVSQLLLTKLAQRRLGYDKPRYGEPWPYPFYSVVGPMVALTNEYTSSDGDIFSHAFKMLKLGKLVGTRTWGGVIGIWPRHALVDGTTTSQPEFSSWFTDVGWGIENYGATPHIEVEYKPQDYLNGIPDPQLGRGLTEILKLMAKNPPAKPNFDSQPNRALPTLPPIKKA